MMARKECPFCEGTKLDGCMFCDQCYHKLPESIKGRIGNGLRTLSESLRAALDCLENGPPPPEVLNAR